MKDLLRFDLIKDTGRTKVIEVFSSHSGDLLGTIHWRNGWRCYVMSYERDVDMSLSCNKQLDDFMQHLEEIRIRDKRLTASRENKKVNK